MTRLTSKEIDRQLDEKLTAENAPLILHDIIYALWGVKSDPDWNGDTLDEIVYVLQVHGLGSK